MNEVEETGDGWIQEETCDDRCPQFPPLFRGSKDQWTMAITHSGRHSPHHIRTQNRNLKDLDEIVTNSEGSNWPNPERRSPIGAIIYESVTWICTGFSSHYQTGPDLCESDMYSSLSRTPSTGTGGMAAWGLPGKDKLLIRMIADRI